MENFRIIDKNEIANNVTLINASKKLKTRSHDFGNIKKNNISKSKEILHFIKEVFVNASGSLIAAGVIQAIQSLV